MITHTRAAVLAGARGAVGVETVPLPEIGPGEVLVQMEACGLCHSDLFVAGLENLPLAPLILGHEGIARAVVVGDGVSHLKQGDRAGITFLASTCGKCALCLSGRERFCARQTNFGYTRNGALTEYAILPAAWLVRVPDSLPACAAAPLCCAGWTAMGAVRESGVEAGQSLALFGMGGLGHLAVQYARNRGIRVAAVDVAEPKLEMARSLGAEWAVPAENAGRTLQKETGGVDAAIVLTASPAAIQLAFRAIKRTGTLVLVGLANAQYELPIVDTVLKGITIRGSYLGTREDLESVFRLAVAGIALPHTTAHTLEEVPALLERMHRGELLGRAVISF